MKKFLLFLLVFFNFTNLNADQIIKYIDIDFILKNSNAGKVIIDELNSINAQNIQELKIKEDELKQIDNEIKKTTNIISETELQVKLDTLKKKLICIKIIKKINQVNF